MKLMKFAQYNNKPDQFSSFAGESIEGRLRRDEM